MNKLKKSPKIMLSFLVKQTTSLKTIFEYNIV